MTAALPPALVETLAGALLFTGVVMLLVLIVLLVHARLVPRGDVRVVVNGREIARAPRGRRLLTALLEHGVLLPSACGGTGTCGMCRVRVVGGGGPALSVEAARLSRADMAAGVRLACQVALLDDVDVELPEDLLGVQEFVCSVRSARSVATFMRELVLDLPAGARLDFRAGAFVQLHCPRYEASFRDFDIPDAFREEWDRLDLWRLTARCHKPTVRAYSLANHPGEAGIAQLVVRIATPPPDAGAEVPPGVVSSYLFSRRPGEEVTITGPFGSFVARDTDREMVFVGGGAGMAPMRSHVLDELLNKRTDRKVTFFYGARSRRELFYDDLFDALQREHGRFTWHVALSEPRPEDAWDGPVGYVHRILDERFLRTHPCPEECEYYLCGPPLMIAATRRVLLAAGVAEEQVMFDDFGGQ